MMLIMVCWSLIVLKTENASGSDDKIKIHQSNTTREEQEKEFLLKQMSLYDCHIQDIKVSSVLPQVLYRV